MALAAPANVSGSSHLRTAVVVALLLALTACGGGSDDGGATVPPNVVPERASAWSSITVRSNADGREAEVPAELRRRASPLLTGRLLAAPEPLSSYGLDAPSATVTYRGAERTRTILVGDTTFDGLAYYVQRQGDPRVFLVPADQLGPLLALVG